MPNNLKFQAPLHKSYWNKIKKKIVHKSKNNETLLIKKVKNLKIKNQKLINKNIYMNPQN